MEYKTIQFELQDHGEIARVRFNRPEQMNSGISHDEIRDVVQEVNDNNIVRVLIVSGNGRVFSAGGDMTRTVEQGAHPPDPIAFREDHVKKGHSEFFSLCRVPTIAMVHGYAMAMGFTYMAQCDLIVAAEGTMIGPYAGKFGDGPQFGGYLFGAMPLRKYKEMVFTYRMMEAEEWCRAGFINRVVPLDKLEGETLTLAREIANINPLITRLQKESIEETLDIMGYKASKKVENLFHCLGDNNVSAWEPEVMEKRQKLGMRWFNHAVRAGAFRDAETRDYVIEESFKELLKQNGSFTDLESMDRVIRESIETIRSAPDWRGPKIR
jgi:enoyl-CoA hydratase/carnithine racemase